MTNPDNNSTVTVKSGDCLWQIASQNLVATGVTAPNNAQIASETDRLARLNKLDYDGRNRDLIYPGEIIKLL